MIGDTETSRGQFLQSLNAFLKIEHRVALPAMKMVVVALVRALVTGCLPWDFNAADKSLLLKNFQRAVDGGDSEGGNSMQSQCMDFVGKEGMFLFGENSLDRLLLFGSASFDGQGFTMSPENAQFKPLRRVTHAKVLR